MSTSQIIPVEAPPHVHSLLRRLHDESLAQESVLASSNSTYSSLSSPGSTARADEVMRDKFIALPEDKASFMYSLVRSTGALNVVEAGTSFGVSTIYLALAVGQNAKAKGIEGKHGGAKVIATEYESSKAAKARTHWREAGDDVERWVELREGDLKETLREGVGEVDFLLLDIWTPMVMPTIRLLEPRFKTGAVILADNVMSSKDGYKEYFEYINRPGSPYKTQTLPYDGGLEMTTYSPAES